MNNNYNNNMYKLEICKLYDIDTENQQSFLLQLDWIIENAVYPLEASFADNLLDLWNVYMPGYKLERTILEYAKIEYPMITYIQSRTLNKFISLKRLKTVALKNYIKYLISQGETNRMNLVKESFDLLKDISNRNSLYGDINEIIELYFNEGQLDQFSVSFLKRFQNSTTQIYIDIINRLKEVQAETAARQNSIKTLFETISSHNMEFNTFSTLIYVLLCKLAISHPSKMSEAFLIEKWNDVFPNIKYTSSVNTFINEYKSHYIFAAKYTIANLESLLSIKSIFKDTLVLYGLINTIEKKEKIDIKEIYNLWESLGKPLDKNIRITSEFESINSALDINILMQYKDDIKLLFDSILARVKKQEFNSDSLITKKNKQIANLQEKLNALEINQAHLSEKEDQIKRYISEINQLNETTATLQKEVLSKFISLLDSSNYDYILGKLYRIAYIERSTSIDEIKLLLRNLFEVISIAGIDIYGDIDTSVNINDLKTGRYRSYTPITQKARIKYPGYSIGEQIIVHPLIEEDENE